VTRIETITATIRSNTSSAVRPLKNSAGDCATAAVEAASSAAASNSLPAPSRSDIAPLPVVVLR
jgi:hypothetical protein